jgi:hypothetical protein
MGERLTKAYKVIGDTIVINRELTELDYFLRDFLKVLIKYSDYLVVSGFVSISTGRTRGTEDIDVLSPLINKELFSKFFNDMEKNNFWCYQGDSSDNVYSYLEELNSIRFAKKDQIFPNIEFIPINEKRKVKFFEFSHPQKIKVKNFEFKIPPIEFEILYKEILLGSEKDKQDAMHLRTFFSEILKKERFKEFELIIKGELK